VPRVVRQLPGECTHRNFDIGSWFDRVPRTICVRASDNDNDGGLAVDVRARAFYDEPCHDAVIWRTQNADAATSRKFSFLLREFARAISSA
jgi:hypothetical protein